MEKKTIWHTPQEKISAYKLVLFCFKNCEIHVERSDELGRLRYGTSYVPEDWMDKWAYIDDLIATSKALDVARDIYLKKCEEVGIVMCPSENDCDALERSKRAFRKVGEVEFDKTISEIMKGGK